MARYEFLQNFRVARNLFFHPRVETENPRLDEKSIQQDLVRSAIWLTPKSVKGFEPEDFQELDAGMRKELDDAVREFLGVASQVPATQPATPEQYHAAAAAFSKIMKLLEPYLVTPYEGERIEEAMKAISFPEWVVNWEYEVTENSEGEPAVYFNVFIDEQNAPRSELGRFASKVTWQIRDVFFKSRVERLPYVRVLSAMEHKLR